jgi:alkylhydroperoxidase family enzyme
MKERHGELPRTLERAALESKGHVPSSTRRAIAEGKPPADVAAYVTKVQAHAYKVTDDDIASLKKSGKTEDEIFEITLAAAVGAAMKRLDAGLAAVRGGK